MPIISSLRLFQCLRCRRQVMVCQSCDTGQRYCARGCRQQARKDACKRARLKYQNSRKGRINNARRQQRFRQRQKEKSKIVTDQASLSIPANALLIEKQVSYNNAMTKPKRHQDNACHFCGRQCTDWFRVGFLKKRTMYPYRSKSTAGETFNDP